MRDHRNSSQVRKRLNSCCTLNICLPLRPRPSRRTLPSPLAHRKAAAPIDLTGYWVSVVTEDWRYRMLTPAKGDYASVPINRRRQEIRRRMGPSQGRSLGKRMQGVRRGRTHAAADPSSHHLGRRQYTQGRVRRGNADPTLSLLESTRWLRRRDLARRIRSEVGTRRCRPRRRRGRSRQVDPMTRGGSLKSVTTQVEAWISAQERRALQR